MTQSSRPSPSKAIPEDDFAVLLDQERRFVVSCGTYVEMIELALKLNQIYQSVAYAAKRWGDYYNE